MPAPKRASNPASLAAASSDPAVPEQRVGVDREPARVVADAGTDPGEDLVQRLGGRTRRRRRGGRGRRRPACRSRRRLPCRLMLPAFVRSCWTPTTASGVCAAAGWAPSTQTTTTAPAVGSRAPGHPARLAADGPAEPGRARSTGPATMERLSARLRRSPSHGPVTAAMAPAAGSAGAPHRGQQPGYARADGRSPG